MSEVPRYPAERPGETPESGGEPKKPPTAWPSMYLWWIASGAAVVLFIVLHLTGVLGPGGH